MLRNESPLSYDEIYIDILASGNWRFSQKLRQYWTMIPPEKKYECFLEFYVTSEAVSTEILCAGLKNTVPLITLSICRENILIKALWRYTAPPTLPPEYRIFKFKMNPHGH